MDKYEYQLKLDQINKLIERNDYATALKIADNIDWKRVRSVNTLSKVADIYEKNEKYEEKQDDGYKQKEGFSGVSYPQSPQRFG